jgi:hypothetical protein
MKKYIIILVAGMWTFSSCADRLDLEPENQITQEQIMAILASGDEAQIDVIIGGLAGALPTWIHRTLGGSDSRVNSCLNLHYANNLQGFDIVVGIETMDWGYQAYSFAGKDGRSSINLLNTSYWVFGWKAVTEANRVLDLLPDEVVGETKKLKGYKASALTLRAYAYNFLMENYRGTYSAGGQGLMIYDKVGGDYKPFSTAGETYDFIKQDLANAVRLFAESEIGENKDGYTANTQDIDLAVANFVRARVSLLTGDYATAITACDAILAKYPSLIAADNYGGNNTGTADNPEFLAATNAFLNFADNKNPEVIFGFPEINDARNTTATWLNPFGTNVGGATGDYARIVNVLYDRIAANDVRKSVFLDGNTSFTDYEYTLATGATSVRTVPPYSNLKYAATHGLDGSKAATSLAKFDVCYMRASEVLLMKAEAQAKNNNESGAKTTLNTLLAARTKTGETDLTCDSYGGGASTTLDQIKLQWRIEMWGENGLEYYNNKRWGVDADRSVSGTNHRNNLKITVDKMTLDIPANESLYNPNV